MTENIEEKEDYAIPFKHLSDEDKTLGIETATYKNGKIAKRVALKNNRSATIRELSALEVTRIDGATSKGKEEDYFFWFMHHAVKIDGNQLPMEEFKKLGASDYNRIKVPMMQLNF